MKWTKKTAADVAVLFFVLLFLYKSIGEVLLSNVIIFMFYQPQGYNFYQIWLNKKSYSARIMCICMVLADLIFLFSQNMVFFRVLDKGVRSAMSRVLGCAPEVICG